MDLLKKLLGVWRLKRKIYNFLAKRRIMHAAKVHARSTVGMTGIVLKAPRPEMIHIHPQCVDEHANMHQIGVL